MVLDFVAGVSFLIHELLHAVQETVHGHIRILVVYILRKRADGAVTEVQQERASQVRP